MTRSIKIICSSSIEEARKCFASPSNTGRRSISCNIAFPMASNSDRRPISDNEIAELRFLCFASVMPTVHGIFWKEGITTEGHTLCRDVKGQLELAECADRASFLEFTISRCSQFGFWRACNVGDVFRHRPLPRLRKTRN
jgi:hypothetical protein